METNKKVTLTVEEFKTITDRLSQLEKGVMNIRPSKVKEHTAIVAVADGQPVVGWNQVADDGTVSGANLKIELLLLDGKKKTLPYLEFIRNIQRVRVKILKTETKERVETEFGKGGGGIMGKVDQKTDKMTGDEVELAVTYVETTMQVEIIDGDLAGQKFGIASNYLNP